MQALSLTTHVVQDSTMATRVTLGAHVGPTAVSTRLTCYFSTSPCSQGPCRVQMAALSSVALLTVELWPNTFAFASDLTKLIGVTICECSLVGAWDIVYLWRVVHDDLPDAYQLLPAVLHAHDMGMR